MAIYSGNSRQISITKTLGGTVGDTVDIGSFNSANGAHNIRMTVTADLSAYSMAKTYEITASYNQTGPGIWRVVPAISSTGRYDNDWNLEINVVNAVVTMRLVKTVGTISGGHIIVIDYTGNPGSTWTEGTASGNITPNTTYYQESFGLQSYANDRVALVQPQKPAFYAYRSAGNIAGGGSGSTYSTIVFNNTNHNVGAHYSTSTGRFTAPTDGYYVFHIGCMCSGGTGDTQVVLSKNGTNYFNNNGTGCGVANSNFEPYGFSVMVYLAEGDYTEAKFYSNNTSVAFYGNGTVWNHFAGYLVM